MKHSLVIIALSVWVGAQRPSCADPLMETAKMIQQMLDHERFNNHKASGRQYYIQKSDLIPSDPDIQFGGKKIIVTEADTGAVFKVKRLENAEDGKPILSLFLVNDNLDAWSTFECQNGTWKTVSFRYVIH